MDLKITLFTIMFALMYYFVYFSRAVTGLLFYYSQVLVYTLIILLSWNDVREYIRLNSFTLTIVLFTLSYISVYFMLGLWVGIGSTPYATSPMGIALNIIYTTSKICAFEVFRILLVNAFTKRYKQLAIYVPTITVWFLTWFPYPILSLTLSIESFKLIFRYLIPSFVSNGFSTYIALNHGLLPSLIYNLIPQVFFKVMPFLPILDWFIEGGVNALTPLIGYIIAIPYSRFPRKMIRKIQRENKSIFKLPLCFIFTFILIAVFQGYAGVKPYVISSNSMNPVLNVGDVVVVCNTCKDVAAGDIIAYVSKWGVVIHRVVEINEDQKYLITKGDANENPDPDPISYQNVIGKVIFRIPILGYPAILIRKISAPALQLIIPLVLLVIMIGLFVIRKVNV